MPLHNKKTRSAFTLVELMVVIIVLGVIAAAVVPNLSGPLESTRLDAAARRVADLMDYCYANAAATGRVHGLIYLPGENRFEIVAEEPLDPSSPPSDQPPELVPAVLPGLLNDPLPEGVVIESAAVYEDDLDAVNEERLRLLFFPDGTTEFAMLSIVNDAGDRREVRLGGVSGTITIVTPEPTMDEGDAS